MEKGTENLLGLLKVRIVKGVDLAIRDYTTSDPYVVIRMDNHKVKTHVVRNNLNPVWNEDLTLPIVERTPSIILKVFDKDTFSIDDPMGNAEIDIQPFVEAVKCHQKGIQDDLPKSIMPSMQNCLAEESRIYCTNGMIVQDIVIRLRDVETGILELQLQYVSLKEAKVPRV